ncbi:hypothetical protein RSOL_499210 [Rhizoctonia solani AG-3 Rhs1AP]|uniref:Uncharacterized protein n=1 Tax=Rhizoctonia solani AG-3 Rhs1AP TaxID=1086054 RepID=X8JV94_9AGAM|nr:hypothetical protein RSOL_499210 [Rhizoctonia solani AG-3 Rhs1AP]
MLRPHALLALLVPTRPLKSLTQPSRPSLRLLHLLSERSLVHILPKAKAIVRCLLLFSMPKAPKTNALPPWLLFSKPCSKCSIHLQLPRPKLPRRQLPSNCLLPAAAHRR